jgi:hypothetical protein
MVVLSSTFRWICDGYTELQQNGMNRYVCHPERNRHYSFVISTGAKRSGEICSIYLSFHIGAMRRSAKSQCWELTPPSYSARRACVGSNDAVWRLDSRLSSRGGLFAAVRAVMCFYLSSVRPCQDAHSLCKTCIGSILAVRYAGRHAARETASNSSPKLTAMDKGSAALVSKSRLRMARDAPMQPSAPRAMPAPAGINASSSTSRMRADLLDPRAMRTPNSAVRSEMEYARTP